MKKYTWLWVAACMLALLLVGCATETTEPIREQTEGTEATTTMSGLEDSIFDDPTFQELEPSVNVVQDTTVPEETTAETQNGTTAPATAPTVAEGETLSYEAWLKLTPKEQRLYQESFKDIEAFYVWYDAAKKAYEEANPPIEIGGGTVDMSTLPT